jgi:hypothetical protein
MVVTQRRQDMATYELTGEVKVMMEAVKFDSGFSKREFVVRTVDDRYPQDIKLECVKDKAALLNDVKPGQRVTVSFDLRGNESKGRYYVSLSAWRIHRADADGPPEEGSEDAQPVDPIDLKSDASDTEPPF